MTMKMLTVVFWVVRLCSSVDGYQRFRGIYHLHLLFSILVAKIGKSTELFETVC
jgi:hypothetical protein